MYDLVNRVGAGDGLGIPFETRAVMGLIPGVLGFAQFGETGPLTLNTFTDVWNYSATEPVYTYPAWATAPIDTLSSDAAGDVGNVVTVRGLDVNGDLVTQTKALNGQNKVTLDTPLWRVYGLTVSSVPAVCTGDVYCYEDTAITGGIPNDTTKVRAFVICGENQSYMTHFTVPTGYTLFLNDYIASMRGATTASINLDNLTRPFGNGFIKTANFSLKSSGSSVFSLQIKSQYYAKEKSDLKIIANSNANNPYVSAFYSFHLWSNSLLASLGVVLP